jgi:hypothetical protein
MLFISDSSWIARLLRKLGFGREEAPKSAPKVPPQAEETEPVKTFSYGTKSLAHIATLSEPMQRVVHRALAISPFDITVIWGYRGEEPQNEAYRLGNSKKQFPDSVHNKMPSEAVDVAPWPIDWNDSGRFYVLVGVMLVAAKLEGVELRSGSDWDRDGSTTDQTFNDLGHFERVK